MSEQITFERLPYLVKQLSEKIDNIERVILENQDQKSNLNPEKPLNVQGAADFLDIKVSTVYSKVSRGELPFIKKQKRIYFYINDLTEYLQKGRKLSNDEINEEAHSYIKKKGT